MTSWDGGHMGARRRKKLVSFFEFRTEKDELLDDSVDWPGLLFEIGQEPIKDRTHPIWSIQHWGQIYTYKGADHFILVRARDEGVSQLDAATGEVIDNETDSAFPWVEVSIVSFVPGTNRFGFVLGSNASPRPSSFAAWINAHRLFDEKVAASPVLSQDAEAKLRGAGEASLVRVTFDSDPTETISRSGGLFDARTGLRESYGDISIELVLKVAGRIDGGHSVERSKLADAARGLLGADFKKAMAQIVEFDESGKPQREDVDFLNDRITKKMSVEVVNEKGKPVRIKSALDAISKATDAMKRDLYGISDK